MQPTALIEENKTHTYDREGEEYYYEARSEFNDLVRAESLTDAERVRKASRQY